MSSNIRTTSIINLDEIKNLFPQLHLENIVRTYFKNKDTPVRDISILELVKIVKKINGIEGLKKLFENCYDSFSKSESVRLVAKLSLQKLKVKFIDDDQAIEELSQTYQSMIQIAAKSELTNRANRKRDRDENPDKNSTSSEHPTKKIRVKEPQSTPKESTSSAASPISAIPQSRPPLTPPSFSATSSEVIRRLGARNPRLVQEIRPAPQNPLSSSQSSSQTNGPANHQKTASQYSTVEKQAMIDSLLEHFPTRDPKDLYLALREYKFDINAFWENYNAGKIDFDVLLRRNLLEELASVKNRLEALEHKNSPAKSEQEGSCPPPELNESKALVKDVQSTTALPLPGFKPPLTWDQDIEYTSAHYRLVPVILHGEEGVAVLQRFYGSDEKSRGIFGVKSIVRIENAIKWNEYCVTQLRISSHNQGKTNEQQLFHGSSKAAMQAIAKDGLDLRLSSFKGAAGMGLYFAEFVRTSLSYIRDCPDNAMQVLLCRVELGSATTIPELHKAYPFASPTNPIRKPQNRPGTTLSYDSVKGNLRDEPAHPIHVIFENGQSYAEYLITFELNMNRIRHARPAAPPPTICPDHPRYRAQLQETKKSFKFLARTNEYGPNKDKPDYARMEKLRLAVLYGEEIIDLVAKIKEELKTRNLPIPPAFENWVLTEELKKELPPELASMIRDELLNIKLPKSMGQLQARVRHYNTLCSERPVILYPDVSTWVKKTKNQVEPAQEQANNTQTTSGSSNDSGPSSKS